MLETIVILWILARNTRRSSPGACASAMLFGHPPLRHPGRRNRRDEANGIILSGGRPASMPRTRRCPTKIFSLGVPILGICYGVQLLAHFLGGKVEKGLKREYGKGTLTVKRRLLPAVRQTARVFAGMEFPRRQAHQIPGGFKSVAVTENSEFAAIENRGKIFRPAISSRSRPHAARQGDHHEFRPWHLRLRQELDHAPLRGPGGGGNPGAGRQGKSDLGLERRRGFQRGGGPVAQGHRRPADLHLRQQRRVARPRGRSGAARSLASISKSNSNTRSPRSFSCPASRA